MRVFRLVLALAALLLAAAAQGPTTSREKQSVLKPPTGAKVAIVIFEDMQCPDCARAHPLIQEVSAQEKIPVLRHDFPLAQHNWAMRAALIGRYFDTKSAKLGEAWRAYVFANQAAITPENLDQYFDKFAKANGTGVPMILDPGGRLEAKIKADVALGKRIGIQHTPTLWVVGKVATAEPFVEVVDRSLLTGIIQDMKSKAK